MAPIGMQNLFVINTAAQGNGRRTATVAAATTFFDITLELACFFGVGLAIDASPNARRLILLAGAVAVTYIGVSLIRAALRPAPATAPVRPALNGTYVDSAATGSVSLWRLIATCFAVTWLNPQAIIDASLLMGGHRASLPPGAPAYFIIGVCIASATWFSTLSVSVAVLRARFSPAVVRAINAVCGTALLIYGLRLGSTLLR